MEREEITKKEIGNIIGRTLRAVAEKEISSINCHPSFIGDEIDNLISKWPLLSFEIIGNFMVIKRKE